MADDLLQLPINIQIATASGCAAYILGFRGIRQHHKSVDSIFIVLVFSLVSTGSMYLFRSVGPLANGAFAFAAPVAMAVLWRTKIRNHFNECIREKDFSWGNDDPSALFTITDTTKHPVTQFGVCLDNGTWLICSDARKFSGSPFGPFIIGPNGDVALYATHEEKDEECKALQHVENEEYGDLMTYIPASRIQRITLRRHRA